MTYPRRWAVLAVAVLGAAAGCGGSSGGAASGTAAVTGSFALTAGSCAAGTSSGSWFRMVQPGGTAAKGPYVSNPDSGCADKTVTLLAPGTAGGLTVGAFQPQPAKPFGAGGNSVATSITAPTGFFAVKFGVSTDAKDPQTGKSVQAPTLTRKGSVLSGSLSAWSVAWNGQQFNQGAPKPDGSGTPATGTYDPATGHATLGWTSTIVGGPFNNFTGVWHLVGTLPTQ